MSSFTLNLSQARENITKSNCNLKNYEENLNIYLSSVLNVDSAWNDNNTIGFMETVKKDRLDLNEQISGLFKYLNIIDDFCDSLNNIIVSNFDLSSLNKISYDLDNLNKLINCINQIYNIVNTNYEILKNATIPVDFKYYRVLKQIEANYLQYRKDIYNTKTKLNKVKSDIENLILKTKSRVNRFEINYISRDVCSHSYKVSSSVLKEVNVNIKNYETSAINTSVAVNVHNMAYENKIDNLDAQRSIFKKELTEDNLKFVDKEHNPLNNKILVDLNNSNLKENDDIKLGLSQTKNGALQEDNLHFVEENKFAQKININTDLHEDTLTENGDIKQALSNVKNETLEEDNLRFVEENKLKQENNININLQETKINPNINKMESSYNNIETNLKSNTISSINNVNAESNIQKTNLNNFNVGTINNVSAANNVVDANLRNS